MSDFIEKYCSEDMNTFINSLSILTTLILDGNDDSIDYNEIFGAIELPNEIKEIDFNQLIKESLRDESNKDLLSIEDVKVEYILDAQGNIVKEILTVSLNAKYDIIFSSMDSDIVFTIEINL